jgi:hypothetical protein
MSGHDPPKSTNDKFILSMAPDMSVDSARPHRAEIRHFPPANVPAEMLWAKVISPAR